MSTVQIVPFFPNTCDYKRPNENIDLPVSLQKVRRNVHTHEIKLIH